MEVLCMLRRGFKWRALGGQFMTRGRSGKVDSMAPDDINENHQVLGRQVWRVIPYAKRYPRRLLAGFVGNACARIVDLVPFVAIGWAVDYFTSKTDGGIGKMVGPGIVQDAVNALHSDPAVGYGFMIFLGFAMLAVFQGISEYSWQTLGYKIQHDLRMDATKSLIDMEASYYDMRQTGQIMSVLSSDVNQL